jgi:probable phosphoglycerate mutase
MVTRPSASGNSLFDGTGSHSSSTGGDWISAHCDGGARGNPGPSGYGALIQSADGSVLAELSEYLGLRTNNYAEYSGLLGCLQWALENNHARLRVVSDSELMVKQIQGKYQVKSPDLKPLYDEAKRRIARLERFEISHALRHKNKDADRLANEAMDRGADRGMKRPVAQKVAAQPIPIARPNRPAVVSTTPIANNKGAMDMAPRMPTGGETMLRGFTRDGVVHVLGGARLPDGVFVKIIQE